MLGPTRGPDERATPVSPRLAAAWLASTNTSATITALPEPSLSVAVRESRQIETKRVDLSLALTLVGNRREQVFSAPYGPLQDLTVSPWRLAPESVRARIEAGLDDHVAILEARLLIDRIQPAHSIEQAIEMSEAEGVGIGDEFVRAAGGAEPTEKIGSV